MTFNLSSRTKLHMNLSLAVLAIVGSAALSTPAFAAAKQSDVVAACKRTKGCTMFPGTNGGVGGCSPHACFSCTNGKCVQVRATTANRSKYLSGGSTIRNLSPASGTASGKPVIQRGNTAPATFAASSNNHMRMGGRH